MAPNRWNRKNAANKQAGYWNSYGSTANRANNAPAKDDTPKNWRCIPCGWTENPAHAWWCKRPGCKHPWKDSWVQPQQQQQQHGNANTDNELAAARAKLERVRGDMGEGHIATLECQQNVDRLVAASATNVSESEQLQKLLVQQGTATTTCADFDIKIAAAQAQCEAS